VTIGWSILAFIFVLTPIILAHEAGHFLGAKRNGIKVDEFGFGFPPRAAKLFTRNGTLYSLNWIPVGGFVRLSGEDDPEVEGGLASSSVKARAITLLGGPVANFILALLLLWIAFTIGPPTYNVVVTEVDADTPAQMAGLMVDDEIISVEGVPVSSNGAVRELVYSSLGVPITFEIERLGELMSIEVTPRSENEFDPVIEGPVGIRLDSVQATRGASQGPIEAAKSAMDSFWTAISGTIRIPAMLFRGEISAQEARPISVVGISQIAGAAAQQSAGGRGAFPLLWFAGIISVALGFTNLLPIPALDGGRLVFLLIEAVRGRRMSPEREGLVHSVGMILLLLLMVVIIVQDLINPIVVF